MTAPESPLCILNQFKLSQPLQEGHLINLHDSVVLIFAYSNSVSASIYHGWLGLYVVFQFTLILHIF